MAASNILGIADYQPPTTDRQPQRTRAASSVRLPVGGGRVSLDDPNAVNFGGLKILSQLSAEEKWRSLALDNRALDRLPAWELMELLIELSPEISKAHFDFLVMCNSGYELKVTRPGSDTEDAASKAIVKDFWTTLKDLYGAPEVLINRLFTALFLRGEVAAEIVLDAAGKKMVDLATPDPRVFDYQQVIDPIRGQIWQLGQWQRGTFVVMDSPTVQLLPVNQPLPGNPRGRSMVAQALFSALFLIGILHDLRRVIAQQGWPRLDIVIKLQELMESLPEDIKDDPTKFKDAIDQAIREVQSGYSQLEPDDTYIHTDTINLNRPVGTVDASSLRAVDSVVAILERMTVRGLKTMPLMLALDQSTNEGQANRQWEIYSAGIASLQHAVENLIGRLLEVGLRAAGKQANVALRFSTLRAAERLRDAQTEGLEILNARNKYAAGWTSQEEASLAITGHAPDQKEPRQTSIQQTGNQVGGNPDPGSSRALALKLADSFAGSGKRNAASLALLLAASVDEASEDEKREAEALWRRVAPDDAKGLIDAEIID